MPAPDFSDPVHRVGNLANMQFFQAYAVLRGFIYDAAWADAPIRDLRIACVVLEANLAEKFDIGLSTLVGAMVDVKNKVKIAELPLEPDVPPRIME